jgi:ABC-type sulfate/molybdate transport systems ATPase subunit
MPQTVLEFRVVVKRFGTVAAVDKVSFSIQSGEIFTLLGPSGCGKTTTLRLVAGLEEPGGEILVNDTPVAAPRRNVFVAPDKRELGMVFQNHEDEARSLIMAMIDGIHFFKTKKSDTLAIIKKHCTELLRIQDDEEWNCFYDAQAASLEAKPYPTLEAIQNVFALALKRDLEIKNFNPLALWDLHYLREIDDSGYINRLYG